MSDEPQFEDGYPIDSDGPFIVIGANGFLGSEICLHLRRRNRWAVIVAPVRNGSVINPRLGAADVRWIYVSQVDTQSLIQCLDAASSGASTRVAGVFLVSGLTIYSDAADHVQAMYESNVRLPHEVLRFTASRRLRTIFCSCSATVGCQFIDIGHNFIAHDDSTRCDLSIASFPHLLQKRNVEEHWHQEGLKGRAPVVILRPSLLLGPGDERVRSTYCILELLSGLGPIPLKYGGGIAFCDVRDVAKAALQCMFGNVHGGTLMNLNAANLPYDEFVELVEKTLRISATSLVPFRRTPRVPSSLLRIAALIITSCRTWYGLPLAERWTPQFIESRLRYYNVSCQRAKAVIRWDPRDLEETIEDTAKYVVRLLRSVEHDGEAQVRRGMGPRPRTTIVGLEAAKAIALTNWTHSPRSSSTGSSSLFSRRRGVLLIALAVIVLLGIIVFSSISLV